jgi:hypothetical protein
MTQQTQDKAIYIIGSIVSIVWFVILLSLVIWPISIQFSVYNVNTGHIYNQSIEVIIETCLMGSVYSVILERYFLKRWLYDYWIYLVNLSRVYPVSFSDRSYTWLLCQLPKEEKGFVMPTQVTNNSTITDTFVKCGHCGIESSVEDDVSFNRLHDYLIGTQGRYCPVCCPDNRDLNTVRLFTDLHNIVYLERDESRTVHQHNQLSTVLTMVSKAQHIYLLAN